MLHRWRTCDLHININNNLWELVHQHSPAVNQNHLKRTKRLWKMCLKLLCLSMAVEGSMAKLPNIWGQFLKWLLCSFFCALASQWWRRWRRGYPWGDRRRAEPAEKYFNVVRSFYFNCTEIRKVVSAVSTLMLFFAPAVLIFGLCMRTGCALVLIFGSSCANVWPKQFGQLTQLCLISGD